MMSSDLIAMGVRFMSFPKPLSFAISPIVSLDSFANLLWLMQINPFKDFDRDTRWTHPASHHYTGEDPGRVVRHVG